MNPPRIIAPGPLPGPVLAVCDELVDVELDTNEVVIGPLTATPSASPITVPITVRVKASVMNWEMTVLFVPPIALITPISRRRSRTIMIIASNTITAPAIVDPITPASASDAMLSNDAMLVFACAASLVVSAFEPSEVLRAATTESTLELLSTVAFILLTAPD